MVFRKNLLKNHFACIIAVILFSILSAKTIQAGAVVLAWNHSKSDGVVGYKVYFGHASRSYNYVLISGYRNEFTVPGIPDGSWTFSVTAIDRGGNESGYSNEVGTDVAGGDPPFEPFPVVRYPVGGMHFGDITIDE